MKVPYSIQGALFSPVCAVLFFVLKVTCPAPSGVGCFADPFITPVFFPVPFLYKMFGNSSSFGTYEPLILIGYWMLVGAIAGLCVDILRKEVSGTSS